MTISILVIHRFRAKHSSCPATYIPSRFYLLLHPWTYRHGRDLWSVASTQDSIGQHFSSTYFDCQA